MEMLDLLTFVGGVMLAVVSYFLKSTMEDLKDVKATTYKTKSDLDLLKNDHLNKYENITDKFDELKLAVVDLTKEIKELNRRNGK